MNDANIIQTVRRYAGSHCDAALDDTCKCFMASDIEGFISYRVAFKTAIVVGDPICHPNDMPKLTFAFHAMCEKSGLQVVYITVTEHFATWAMKNVCKSLIEFGEELSLDPHINPREGSKGRLLRRKCKHSAGEGTTVLEYTGSDSTLEQQIEEVGDAWLRARSGPQIFTSHVRLFEDRIGKRWFYALNGASIVGVVVLNRLEKSNGWHINHLMSTKQAPNGTPELLVTTAIEKLIEEDCHFVSFGTVSCPNLGKLIGFNKYTKILAHFAYKMANKFFKLQGRKKFWEKFSPSAEPSYILFSQKGLSIIRILAILKSLNASM